MKRYIGISLLTIAAVFGMAACGSEEKEKVMKEVKQEETKKTDGVKEQSEKVKEQSEKGKEVKKNVTYAKAPLEIQKQEQLLYENESGAIRYLGYTKDKVTGYTLLALRYEGEIAHLDEDNMAVTVIAEDSTSDIFVDRMKIETRVTDEGEVHLYKLDKDFSGKNLVRMDVVFERKADGGYEEKDKKTIQLKPSSGTMDIPGIEAIDTPSYSGLSMKKEGKDMDVEVKAIELSPDYKEIKIAGILDLKKDIKDRPEISFYQPVTRYVSSTKVGIKSETSSLFAGTKIPFESTISLKETVGKKDGVIYFSVESALYAFNLATGKELDEVSLTGFLAIETNRSNKLPSTYGFKDVSGKSHYDAMKAVGADFDLGSETTRFGNYQYPIADDYKTVTFNIGAGEGKSVHTGDYIVRVYGDDYKVDKVTKQIVGTPIVEKKINKNSPMEPVTVDVEGIKVLTIHYDTNVKTPQGESSYIPMIISDMILKK
ncbi:hypothetical protein [Bacillus luti]|uniref:hypothetical protein n=1 Tax=Bacillus luti TaxID=2026191 RepID=UPI0012E80391|nr:hypothetical protein [Bacillus luti]